MSPSTAFLEAVKARRTIYALSAKSPIPDSKIQEIVEQAVLHTPSSFNSQSTRVVLLVKDEHKKLWDFAKEALKAIVPAEAYPATEQKLNGFQAGYGTVSSYLLSPFLNTCHDPMLIDMTLDPLLRSPHPRPKNATSIRHVRR